MYEYGEEGDRGPEMAENGEKQPDNYPSPDPADVVKSGMSALVQNIVPHESTLKVPDYCCDKNLEFNGVSSCLILHNSVLEGVDSKDHKFGNYENCENNRPEKGGVHVEVVIIIVPPELPDQSTPSDEQEAKAEHPNQPQAVEEMAPLVTSIVSVQQGQRPNQQDYVDQQLWEKSVKVAIMRMVLASIPNTPVPVISEPKEPNLAASKLAVDKVCRRASETVGCVVVATVVVVGTYVSEVDVAYHIAEDNKPVEGYKAPVSHYLAKEPHEDVHH